MKISEAEKLICPFIRAVDRGGWNRYNGCPSHINCITDKCMAWKMTNEYSDTTSEQCTYDDVNGDKKTYWKRDKLPREDCEGYCRRLR